ncbi:MAG: DUF3426 domain-containing protein [Desulfuromonadales bacterium]|nr:DUF3426 domain-containing protein [Desulfuromonadales bacterium]
MVISCPECSTKFRVAAEKIPVKGAKLRCARCSHIFFVKPEAEPAPAPAEEIPAAAAPASDPFAAEDPSPGAQFAADETDFGFEEPAPPAAQPEAKTDFRAEDIGPIEDDPFADDSDFGFGELTSSPPEADFAFEDPAAEQAGSADLDFDFTDSAPETAEPAAPERTEDDFGFGSFEAGDSAEIGAGVNDEFDASAFEDDTPASDDAFSFDEDYGNVELGGKDEDEQAFSFDEDFSAGSAERTAGRSEPEDEISTEEAAAGFSEEPGGVEPPADLPPVQPYPPLEDDDHPHQDVVETAPVAKKRSPFSTLIIFLLLLIIGIVIAGGVLYWQSGPQALEDIYRQLTGQQAATQVEGQILIKNLQGSFVTNKVAGELLVIQGNAVNDYKESRAAIQVKGVLFDSQGKQLRQKTIFCGNPITTEDLRSLPYDKLEEIMGNQFGESLVNLNVTPGQVIPFTIVFRDIPDNLSEFVVEVADSNPAAQ